ncbi:YncE family protein [Salinimicrobium sp. HB62]|uniref:YncE family protein n=1 Tax=Salinimicrobium sp. HB62 TaxID=3077781 RepID=UPI002D7776CD|nr:DUF5074 domain-containing protein [Salinimicrobium sp. HB62]
MQIRNYLLLLFMFSLLTSCEVDDDNNPVPDNSGAFSEGILVLNEGLWGQGNSSVSFIDGATGEVKQGIYSEVNGSDLGDTASDIGFYEDLAFIVVNVSNTIEIVDRRTFESVATIDSELENPRKIAFLMGLAYITNWGDASDPSDDFIAVFDARTFDFLDKIEVEEGPEDILAIGEKLFVAHQGGWSFNDIISVISGDEVEKTITVGDVPNDLSEDNGFLWVSSAGLPDYAGETAGEISKIDLSTMEVVKTFSNAAATWHPSNITVENGLVYYTLGTEVYSFGSGEETLPSEPLFNMEEVSNLYGFRLHEGRIYAASASADYTGDGKLYIYNTASGNLENTYDTGINPNGIFIAE